MRQTFAEAVDRIRLQAEGWVEESNVRELTAASPEEIEAFAAVWTDLGGGERYQLVRAMADLAEEYRSLAYDSFFEMALDDDIGEIRAEAVAGLGEAFDLRLAGKILRMFRNDSDADVRAEAATILGTYLAWAGSQEESLPFRREVEEALLEAINTEGEDLLVRRRALEAYGYAEDPFADEVLMEAYDSEDDEMVASAIFAMGRRLDDEWLNIVHRELASEVEEIRLAATYAAGEIGSGSSVPFLLRVIGEDPSDDVRVAAVYSLSEIEAPEAGRILEDLLESEETAISVAAEDALELREAEDGDDEMVMFDYGLSDEDDHRENGRA